MLRRATLFVLSLVLVVAPLSAPAAAHQSLRTGRYECWLSAITQYSYFDLKIMSGGRYAFLRDNEVVGSAGRYVHDGKKVRFTSGFLKKKGYTGRHLVDDDALKTHIIYVYKNGEMIYDCNNN